MREDIDKAKSPNRQRKDVIEYINSANNDIDGLIRTKILYKFQNDRITEEDLKAAIPDEFLTTSGIRKRCLTLPQPTTKGKK